MSKKKIDLIGAALGWGAQNHETQNGPKAIAEGNLDAALQQARCEYQWRAMIQPDLRFDLENTSSSALPYVQKLAQVTKFNQNLAHEVSCSVTEGNFPIILGGDHAIAIGTWKGVMQALSVDQDFGLIWIDAHLDANTPQTSPSEAIHGMPAAVLLGEGESELINLLGENTKIKAENLVYFGIRSFEEGEQSLLVQKGGKIYYMQDIAEGDLVSIFREIVSTIKNKTTYFGVTLDLDAFDPEDAPGVGSPESNGLRRVEMLKALQGIALEPQCRALEITEYNPQLDKDNITRSLVTDLIVSMFSHKN
tara:strand:- start:38221 stop:39141 length:921 start_codon:yes stop_codon:yes gene_type:complete